MTATIKTDVAAEAVALAAAADQVQRKAAEAQARAEEAAQRAEERRQGIIDDIRRQRLAAYDHAALTAEERSAELAFREAIAAGGAGILEFVTMQAARTAHYLIATECRSIQSTLDPDAPAIPVPGVAGGTYAEAVEKVVQSLLGIRTADFEDERQAELDDAGL